MTEYCLIESIFHEIADELEKAEKKHPYFPKDHVGRCSIMAEEAGEAIKEANNLQYEIGSKEDLKQEILHTACVCVRILKAMKTEEK